MGDQPKKKEVPFLSASYSRHRVVRGLLVSYGGCLLHVFRQEHVHGEQRQHPPDDALPTLQQSQVDCPFERSVPRLFPEHASLSLPGFAAETLSECY